MDWKYKHFHQERVFHAAEDTIKDAARSYVTEDLGWKVLETSDGMIAEGSSANHSVMAEFQFHSDAAGARVTIDLKVERASVRGFMLFDVGGYYNIQMRKWLAAIQARVTTK